jgi:hypothetical protein
MTYGSELEMIDWPRLDPLPFGMAIDDGNYTSVNSNGVAVDGKGKSYHLGGEILTRPSLEPSGPSDQMVLIKKRWPEATHNYRTGLNVNVRVPGLREDLKRLKRLQAFVHQVMPELLPVIDPIPVPSLHASKGERLCHRVRKKDHHTLVPKSRLALQMQAASSKEFFEAEVKHEKTGKLLWALTPRPCVNLRQMLQTDTVEFRHFFMPDSPEELLNSVLWCKLFLEASFDGSSLSAKDLLREFDFKSRAWPKPLPYDPWLDEGFFYTSPHHNPADVVKDHIEEWLTIKGGERAKCLIS